MDNITYDYQGDGLTKEEFMNKIDTALIDAVNKAKTLAHDDINQLVPMKTGVLRTALHAQVEAIIPDPNGGTFALIGTPYVIYVEQMSVGSLTKSGIAPNAVPFFTEKIIDEIIFNIRYYFAIYVLRRGVMIL